MMTLFQKLALQRKAAPAVFYPSKEAAASCGALKELHLRPELELLVLCGRKTLDSDTAQSIDSLLTKTLDWSLILREAQRHCVLPLLHAHLAARGHLRCMPAEAQEALQASVRAIAATNLALAGELMRIVQAFERCGIRAIPFKGPMLALAAYGDYSLRSFADLDILVDESDLARARSVLEAGGYRPAWILTAREECAYLKNECAFQFQNPRRGFVVELHWRFSERNASVSFPLAEFRQRAATVSLNGIRVSTLAVEDLLPYLCVHGAKHYWDRLEWICCVAELIRRHQDLDWITVQQRAKAWRIERLLHLGLGLARLLFDAPMPPALLDRVRANPHAASLAHTVASRLFGERDKQHYQNRASRYLFLLNTRESYVDRFRILLFSAIKPPHPGANEWIDLPPHLLFLQYIFRPIRLLSEYGSVAWRFYSGTRQ